jgi:hypothetical protein
MTRRATRNIHRAAQVVLVGQILTEFHLVGIAFPIHLNRQSCRRLLVSHIKNLLTRPQIFLRPAMTLNAPLHLQRCVVKHQRHAVHRPVAGVAPHPFVDVNAVIKINKVGKIIHPVPQQRLPSAKTFAYRFEQRRRRPDLRMAVHAGLGWRNSSEPRGLNRSVAIAAVDTERSHVVLVAERRRLGPSYARICDIRRALEIYAGPQSKGERKDPHINRGPGNYVSAAMENLHRSGFFLQRNLQCDPSF